MWILAKGVHLVLRAVETLMILRALLSWIMPPDANQVTRFLYNVTEPIIEPVRRILGRFEFFRSCPIDLTFLAALLIIDLADGVIRLLF